MVFIARLEGVIFFNSIVFKNFFQLEKDHDCIPGLTNSSDLSDSSAPLPLGSEWAVGKLRPDLLLPSIQRKKNSVFLNIFSFIPLDFLFQGTSYSWFHHFYLPYLSDFFWVSEMMFFYFSAPAEITSDLYSLPSLILSHVCSVLYCSDLFIMQSSCHLALKLRFNSVISSPYPVDLYYLVFGALVLLDFSYCWSVCSWDSYGEAPWAISSAFFSPSVLLCMFAVSVPLLVALLYPCLVSESALSLPLPAWVQSEWTFFVAVPTCVGLPAFPIPNASACQLLPCLPRLLASGVLLPWAPSVLECSWSRGRSLIPFIVLSCVSITEDKLCKRTAYKFISYKLCMTFPLQGNGDLKGLEPFLRSASIRVESCGKMWLDRSGYEYELSVVN